MDSSSSVWEPVVSISTLAGVLVAALALLISAQQAKKSALSARAMLWLELRRMFMDYHDTAHANFHPGGAWSEPGWQPTSVEDRVRVETYMGLFEHCEDLLEQEMLDWPTFEAVYWYRVKSLVKNDWVRVEKLVKHRAEWLRFHRLLRRANIVIDGEGRERSVADSPVH
jgi:hypothetical protein